MATNADLNQKMNQVIDRLANTFLELHNSSFELAILTESLRGKTLPQTMEVFEKFRDASADLVNLTAAVEAYYKQWSLLDDLYKHR